MHATKKRATQKNPWPDHERRWSKCKRCPLHLNADKHVLARWGKGGVIGNPLPANDGGRADVLFIGEAPGHSENIVGEPFVGPAGKLLDRMLLDAITRSKVSSLTWCISNIVACIPLAVGKGEGMEEVTIRPPTKEEAAACAPRLVQLAAIVQPVAVVTLGKVAEKYLPELLPTGTIATHLCLLHPAYVLRKGGAGSLEYKREVLRLTDFFQNLLR